MMTNQQKQAIIVGITGTSRTIYSTLLLNTLKNHDVEVRLVITKRRTPPEFDRARAGPTAISASAPVNSSISTPRSSPVSGASTSRHRRSTRSPEPAYKPTDRRQDYCSRKSEVCIIATNDALPKLYCCGTDTPVSSRRIILFCNEFARKHDADSPCMWPGRDRCFIRRINNRQS